MKKLLAILLALVMVLSMAACGGSGSGEPDPNLGKYDAVSAEMSGLSLNVKSVFKDGFSIELKNGGKATFHYDGKDYSMKWTLEGDTFNAKGGGAELSGTLADGKMVLENVLDSGISITLIDPEHKSDEPEAPAEANPNAGVYKAVTAEMSGVSVDLDDVFEDGFSIELKDDGTASFTYNGVEYNIKTTIDGEKFHAEAGGAVLDGTIAEGVLTLDDLLGTGLKMTLVDETRASVPETAPDAEETAEPEPEPTAEPTEEPKKETEASSETKPGRDAGILEWWNGRWYGWFVMYLTDGDYAEDEDSAFDVLADIDVDADGGTIEMWTIDDERDDVFSSVTVRYEPLGGTEYGKLISEDGYCFEDTVEPDEWSIDPASSFMSEFEHVICIAGKYVEPEDENSWFEYLIFLRPWGMDWEDVRDSDSASMPYDDMLPMEYDEWYLPQIGKADSRQEEPAAEAPADSGAPAETAALHPNEPSSAGDGLTTMDNLLRFYKWMDTMDFGLKSALTYQDMVDAAGVEGKDCGNTGPNSVSELGDHYFNWYADDTHFLHVGFRGRSDGTWTYCGMNTSNITKADYEDVDISDMLPKAGGETRTAELSLKDFYDKVSGKVTADVPAEKWFPQEYSGTAYFYNAASEDKIGSSTARIQIAVEQDLEKFDFYKDKFENLKDLDPRTIGGIEMAGRSYTQYGMDWIEYLGASPEGVAVSVKISGVPIGDGSEGDAVLNSIRFSFD